MTSEKSLEKLMKNVDESRRDFIRKAIWGTAFAVPVLASFSMEGGMIGTAEAYASNQCSNMYSGPDSFDAVLRRDNGHKAEAKWEGVLTADGKMLAYKLLLISKKLDYVRGYLVCNGKAVAQIDKGTGAIDLEGLTLCLEDLLQCLVNGNGAIDIFVVEGDSEEAIVLSGPIEASYS